MQKRLPKRLKSLVDGMKKKILITATELNLVQFWVAHIENLIKSGCTVDIVCSDVGGKLSELKARLQSCGNPQITVVDLKRSPLSPHNIRGAAQMKRYLNGRDYDLILTNEPVMGMVTRFAASKKRRSGCKVIYFAHGFHFWRGAPASKGAEEPFPPPPRRARARPPPTARADKSAAGRMPPSGSYKKRIRYPTTG